MQTVIHTKWGVDWQDGLARVGQQTLSVNGDRKQFHI